MKIKTLFNASVAGSSSVVGSILSNDASMSDENTVVVQFSSNDAGSIADITLEGRLVDFGGTNFSAITTGALGGIQMVPRCASYRVSVVNSNAGSRHFGVAIGI